MARDSGINLSSRVYRVAIRNSKEREKFHLRCMTLALEDDLRKLCFEFWLAQTRVTRKLESRKRGNRK